MEILEGDPGTNRKDESEPIHVKGMIEFILIWFA